jgi:radical SAM-linked protein
VAYSEGFNPHPKIAFGAPLPVGVEGEREYVDIDIREDYMEQNDIESITKLLQRQLPAGIAIKEAAMMPAHPKALMAIINLARYRVKIPFTRKVEIKEIELALEHWLAKDVIMHNRRQRDKIVEKDIRQYVIAANFIELTEYFCILQMDMKIGNDGTARPGDILDSLILLENMPVDKDGVVTVREGLYVGKDNELLSPVEYAL